MSTLRGATRIFVQNSFKIETDDCIHWPYSLDKRGYAQASDAQGFYKPYRRVCEWQYGPPPPAKHHAAHSCGNRSCINKRHLSWKTPKENEADKRLHGRMADNRPSRRKLTVEDVKTIRHRSSIGEPAFAIAREYPVTLTAIKKIISRATYRDV